MFLVKIANKGTFLIALVQSLQKVEGRKDSVWDTLPFQPLGDSEPGYTLMSFQLNQDLNVFIGIIFFLGGGYTCIIYVSYVRNSLQEVQKTLRKRPHNVSEHF